MLRHEDCRLDLATDQYGGSKSARCIEDFTYTRIDGSIASFTDLYSPSNAAVDAALVGTDCVLEIRFRFKGRIFKLVRMKGKRFPLEMAGHAKFALKLHFGKYMSSDSESEDYTGPEDPKLTLTLFPGISEPKPEPMPQKSLRTEL